MKFLVVDDSAIIRQKIINTFIGYDIQFDQAADGAEALNFLEVLATDYDLITLDWNMPNVTGIEVLEKMKAKEMKIPVVMVTTESQRAEVVRAMLAGAKNYVVKPFDGPSLITKVSDVLKQVNKELKKPGG